jgi:predicted NAD-dependent protein-ADP-ribosyltransferase YbiA (DUF1768 family)
MKNAVKFKFLQHPHLRDLLLSTGKQKLAEELRPVKRKKKKKNGRKQNA